MTKVVRAGSPAKNFPTAALSSSGVRAMSDAEKPQRDYRDTVFLPKTDFPMKAGLPQKEPAILTRWKEADLYGQLRAARAGREKFILHDGPPYANGDIHIGHVLNKTLKDLVVRTQKLTRAAEQIQSKLLCSAIV